MKTKPFKKKNIDESIVGIWKNRFPTNQSSVENAKTKAGLTKVFPEHTRINLTLFHFIMINTVSKIKWTIEIRIELLRDVIYCLEALKLHDWKGNIRELKNVIERGVILSEKNELDIDSLPPEFQKPDMSGTKTKQLSTFNLAGAEKNHVQKVMQYTNGNKTETARLLNIALTTLYRKLDEYGIK